MKLRELLDIMQKTSDKIGSSSPWICGGTPRDRYLKHLENISDLDITTGDKTVDYLSQEFSSELSKKFNVTRRSMDDGHSAIYIGSFKMDFSSNFNVPNIITLLKQKGINNPTEMQKEMFSRDFTCNALLLSLDLKNVIDPTHKGFEDMKARIIRTCLSPEITLTTNRNRVVRAIYLAAKLDFDIDPAIIEFVKKNPASIKISTEKAMAEKLNEAFNRNADRAAHYITKMNLWKEIPITEVIRPYYLKNVQQTSKVAYFQGGGGVNEPTPGKKKYKSEKAIVVQPRFEEPLYKNYDVYNVSGKHGPGAGYHDLQKYKSVSDFLKAKRKKMKDKYKADDTWIEDDGKCTKKNPGIKTRASLLNRIIKIADDENDGPNFDYGKGLYSNMDKYKSVKDFEDKANKGPGAFFAEDNMLPPKEHGTSIYNWKNSPYQGIPKAPKKHDSNAIDFPNDEYIDPGIAAAEHDSPDGDNPVGTANPGGGYLDEYLTENDFEEKPVSTLDFGRDYTQQSENTSLDEKSLEKLINKYLSPGTHGLYGLPDGADLPDEDLAEPTNINPDYGTIGPESLIYEDKWNI